jgi:hypothetical protein
VFDKMVHLLKNCFAREAYEKLTNAMLPTGDEQFLSLAMDGCSHRETGLLRGLP